MMHPHVDDLMPGERVLWQGAPAWQAVARDVLHIRWIGSYVAVFLIYGLYSDRSHGLGPVAALLAGVPFLLLGLAFLGACAGFARLCARTTRYTITNERCLLKMGIALEATVSIPLRSIAAVAVTVRGDGSGDIPLALQPGRRLAFLKLWPHARPWRFQRAQPMLRGVADAALVATVLSRAVAAVIPGQLAAARATDATDATDARGGAGLATPAAAGG